LGAGVLGYVLKARLATDLIPAIDEVLNGNTFVSGLRDVSARNYL
jgi:hypothetical protein